MKLKSLEDLMVDELRDLYDAERQITKALPKLAKQASSSELKSAFEEHLSMTEAQIERLDRVFEQLDQKPKGKPCAAMKGLIHEADELMKQEADPEVIDAGLIGCAQKVEHYEIAGYGTARTHAQTLGYDSAVRLLEQTLEEEKETDQKLTRIAEKSANRRAASLETDQE